MLPSLSWQSAFTDDFPTEELRYEEKIECYILIFSHLIASNILHMPQQHSYYDMWKIFIFLNHFISVRDKSNMTFASEFYLWRAGPIYIQDLTLVITVPADALAPAGARASAGIVMTIKLNSAKFLWLSMILCHNRALAKSYGILSFDLG